MCSPMQSWLCRVPGNLFQFFGIFDGLWRFFANLAHLSGLIGEIFEVCLAVQTNVGQSGSHCLDGFGGLHGQGSPIIWGPTVTSLPPDHKRRVWQKSLFQWEFLHYLNDTMGNPW